MNTNSVNFFKSISTSLVQANTELILAVWNISNPGNMGYIIRLAHNIGAQKLWFVNNDISVRESKIKKTAGFSFQQMNWEIISEKKFLNKIAVDSKLIAIETCEGAKSIFETRLPPKAILLAGNESYGIPENVLKKCTAKVYIPMPGGCKSMNVSHALSVVSFEWYRQQNQGGDLQNI